MNVSYSNLISLCFVKNHTIFEELLNIEGYENNFDYDLLNIKLLYNVKNLFFFRSFFEHFCNNKILVKIENFFCFKNKTFFTNKCFIFVVKKRWSSILIKTLFLRLRIQYGITIYKKSFKSYIFLYFINFKSSKYFNILLRELYLFFIKIIVFNFNIKIRTFYKEYTIISNIKNSYIKFFHYKVFDNISVLNIDRRIYFTLKINSFKIEKTLFEIFNKICCLNNYLKTKTDVKIISNNFSNSFIDIIISKKYDMFFTSSFTNKRTSKSIEIYNSNNRYLRTNLRNKLIKSYYFKDKFFEVGFVFDKKVIQKKRLCIAANISKISVCTFAKDVSFILDFFNKIEFNKDSILLKKSKIKYGLIGNTFFRNNNIIFLEIDIDNRIYNHIFEIEKYFYKNIYRKYFVIKINKRDLIKLIKYRSNFFMIKNYTKGNYIVFLVQLYFYYNSFKDFKKKQKDMIKKTKMILNLSC